MNVPLVASNRPNRAPTTSRRVPPRAPTVFKVFVAYADVPAARRALSEIRCVLAATRRDYQFEPMLWRFDQLTLPNWRDVALGDAAAAAVVVLASSGPGPIPRPLEHWVSTFLSHKQSAPITLVALLGASEAWTISIDKPRPAGSAKPMAQAIESPGAHVLADTSAAHAA